MALNRDDVEAITEALRKQVEYQERLNSLQGDRASSTVRERQELSKQMEFIQEINGLLGYEKELAISTIELREEQLKKDVARGRILRENYDAQMKQLADIKKIREDQIKLEKQGDTDAAKREGERLERLKKILEAKEKELAEQLKINMATAQGEKAAAGFAGMLARSLGFSTGLTFQLLKAAEGGAKLSIVFAAFGKQLAFLMGPAGVLAMILTNTVAMAFSLDKAAVGFTKITGAGADFTGVIASSFRNTSQFATSLQETSQAASSLFSSLTGFSDMSKGLQTVLVENATILGKIGINAEMSGEMMRELQFAFGKTKEEANEFTRTLAKMAIGLGAPPKAIQQQYMQLIPQLSFFGDRGDQVFSKVAKAAKDLGMSVKTGAVEIFNMTKDLDTFSGSAQKVAAMNLTLGGSFINAFDLTMAAAKGPVEQVRMLQDAFSAAGKSIDDLGFFEAKFLADSMGISFTNLQKVMKGQITMEEAQITSEEKLVEILGKASTMGEKLIAAVQNMAGPFETLARALTPLITGFANFVGFMDGIPALAALTFIAFRKLTVATASMGTAAATASLAFAGIFAGFLIFEKIKSVFPTIKKSTILLGALAVSIIAAVVAATAGIAGGPIAAGLVKAAGGLSVLGAGVGFAALADPGGMDDPIGGEGAVAPTGIGVRTAGRSRQVGGYLGVGQTGLVHPNEGFITAPPGSGFEVINQREMRRFNDNLERARQGGGNNEVLAALHKQNDLLEKFMLRPQGPSEISVKLGRGAGKELARATVNEINRGFSPLRDARMPSEGLI